MTVETHAHTALERVQHERDHVEEQRSAYRQFERTVEECSARRPGKRPDDPHATDGGVIATPGTSGQSRCKQVRTAFEKTISSCARVQSDAGDGPLSALCDELGEEIALVLAPATDGQFTPQVKRAVLSAVANRREELGTLSTALEAEAESVRTAIDTVEDITDWLVTANETPLTELGFDTLQQRHEILTEYRRRCSEASTERQTALQATTSRDGTVGVSHRSVVDSLYAEFPVENPILTTLTRLDRSCADCQRAVRDHLVRRV